MLVSRFNQTFRLLQVAPVPLPSLLGWVGGGGRGVVQVVHTIAIHSTGWYDLAKYRQSLYLLLSGELFLEMRTNFGH